MHVASLMLVVLVDLIFFADVLYHLNDYRIV